jgi:hypothetical protein
MVSPCICQDYPYLWFRVQRFKGSAFRGSGFKSNYGKFVKHYAIVVEDEDEP